MESTISEICFKDKADPDTEEGSMTIRTNGCIETKFIAGTGQCDQNSVVNFTKFPLGNYSSLNTYKCAVLNETICEFYYLCNNASEVANNENWTYNLKKVFGNAERSKMSFSQCYKASLYVLG